MNNEYIDTQYDKPAHSYWLKLVRGTGDKIGQPVLMREYENPIDHRSAYTVLGYTPECSVGSSDLSNSTLLAVAIQNAVDKHISEFLKQRALPVFRPSNADTELETIPADIHETPVFLSSNAGVKSRIRVHGVVRSVMKAEPKIGLSMEDLDSLALEE